MGFDKGISRRSFLTGAALSAAALAGGLTACSATPKTSEEKDEPQNQDIGEISETLDADIVIVGAGISGLSCAVQAAEQGNRVIVLEKGAQAGGNGSGVEGIFAVNSPLQQEKGIHIDPVDIIASELVGSQYRVDASLWVDMIENSGDNFLWLQENGVQFNGVVDNYHTGKYETMHWFNGDFGGGGACYVPQMQAAAEKYGAEFRMSTAASALSFENGSVSGVYAVNSDGNTILINAKAVVLASGGVGYNKDLLLKQGWTSAELDRMDVMCAPTIVGDGYAMARSAGAKDFLPHSCDQVFNNLKAYAQIPNFELRFGGPVLWVNQDARRFSNEAMYWINLGAQHAAAKGNRDSFMVYDQAILDSYSESPEVAEQVKAALSPENEDYLYSSDSLEDLAEHFGLNPQTFAETVEKYNSFCHNGKDLEIGKDPQFLKALETPPFYIARITYQFVAIDGGITTNLKAEVLDDELNTIPGLYAVGLDGAMMWRTIYTQDIPGTLMGHNVNSGRNAARNATDFIAAE